MAEVVPARATISFINFVREGFADILTGTSAARSLFEASRLLNPDRTIGYRTLTDTSPIGIKLKFKEDVLPSVISLISCNLNAGVSPALMAASDEAFTTDLTIWALSNTYAQSRRQILRWYLGAADFGTAAARKYWRLVIPALSTIHGHLRLGNIWMGEYTEFPYDIGLRVRQIDPSRVTELPSGSRFADRSTPYHTISIGSSFMPRDEALAMREQMEARGVVDPVLIDLGASATDPVVKAAQCYYGYLGDRDAIADFEHEHQIRQSISWEFVEQRAA